MNFLAALALFLAPSIYFLLQNLGLGKDIVLFLAPITSIVVFGIVAIFFSPLLLLKKKKPFILIISFISSFWYLQFLMPDLLLRCNFFLQLAIITSVSLFIVVISTQINIARFVLIFLGLNVLAIGIPKTEYLFRILNRNFFNHESVRVIKTTPKVKDVNIYYVLADGLTSLNELNQTYKVSTSELDKNLKAFRYSVFYDAKSSYNITHLTLASIFTLDYPVIEGSQKYKDRADFFPNMLSTPDRVPLLVKLDSLDYKFVHIGNKWSSCSKNKFVNCLSDHQVTPLKYYIPMLSEDYSIQTFLQKTLFKRVINYLFKEKKLEYESYKKELISYENNNDALGTITSAIKSNRINSSGRTFYFVHHLNPHPPNLRQDCSVSDDEDYQDWTVTGYSESSKCAIKRISEFIKVINEVDPKSIVVIQGDHGPAITYNFDKNLENFSKNELEERFSIINAIKLPNGCILPTVKNLGNVETIQWVMDCITGTSTANEYSKSYAGFYEKHKNFGEVFEVKFKN